MDAMEVDNESEETDSDAIRFRLSLLEESFWMVASVLPRVPPPPSPL